MPLDRQHCPGLALVLLLGGADVDGAEDRRRHEQDRDRADEAGRGGGAGEVLARDADERERERPDGEHAAADVEGVHVAESYRTPVFTEESQTGSARSPRLGSRCRRSWTTSVTSWRLASASARSAWCADGRWRRATSGCDCAAAWSSTAPAPPMTCVAAGSGLDAWAIRVPEARPGRGVP